MKATFGVLVCACLSLSTQGLAADAPPFHADAHNAEVRIHTGTTPITVVTGDNPLDKLRTFTCKVTAGCAIAITATAYIQNPSVDEGLCPKVDGADGSLPCDVNSNIDTIMLAHTLALVGKGQHTFQTVLHSEHDCCAIVAGWEAEYTIYPKRTKGQ